MIKEKIKVGKKKSNVLIVVEFFVFIFFSMPRKKQVTYRVDKQNSLLGYRIWIDNSIFNTSPPINNRFEAACCMMVGPLWIAKIAQALFNL